MATTARGVILDLLSTLKGGAMPVRTLVHAGALLGLEENAVRVALARLLAAGTVERDERGQYRPGATAEAVNRHVTSWRVLEERVRRWDGSWIGVHTIGLPRATRRTGRVRARALGFLGFRRLLSGLEIRPDNLVGGVEAVRSQLRALGLEGEASVFRLSALDATLEARARTLWDAAALRTGYRTAERELARSAKRLPGLPPSAAMAESFVLGGRVIRRLVFDPLLPEPMVPAAERRALIAAMQRYDRLGRACWSGLLREHGVLHDRAPAEVRIADAPSGLEYLTQGAGA